MFEKEAELHSKEWFSNNVDTITYETPFTERYCYGLGFKDGAEFGYNKANEDVKHDLMMKLKDEGIVKPLKDSILRNEQLSSQEQQELCAWIECAIDFGENLDECAKELEELHKANEWHYVKDGDLPTHENYVLVSNGKDWTKGFYKDKKWNIISLVGFIRVIAWKEIILPSEDEIEQAIKEN